MPYVKLDTGILNSTIWFDHPQRDLFITALLMAEPHEVREPLPQLRVTSLDPTGFLVPPGWYGFVPAAGPGIAARAGHAWDDNAREALERLSSPEPESRSQEFEGRRLARVNGGWLVLNYFKYRDKDHTSAVRSARYRARKQAQESRRDVTESRRDEGVTGRSVTQAEAEAEVQEKQERTPVVPKGDDGEKALTTISKTKMGHAGSSRFDRFWSIYPKKVGKGAAMVAWNKARLSEQATDLILAAVERQKRSAQWLREGGRFIPNPATWLNQQRWDDAPDPEVPQLSDRTIGNLTAGEAFLRGDYDRKR